jgi:hypothetical protein
MAASALPAQGAGFHSASIVQPGNLTFYIGYYDKDA